MVTATATTFDFTWQQDWSCIWNLLKICFVLMKSAMNIYKSLTVSKWNTVLVYGKMVPNAVSH